MTARQEKMADAPYAARLVGGAAEGDARAWGRLVDQYEQLISAVSSDFPLADIRQEIPARERAAGDLLVAECGQSVRDDLLSLPRRWQPLLAMLIAPQLPAHLSRQTGQRSCRTDAGPFQADHFP